MTKSSEMELLNEYLIPWSISNVFSVIILLTVFRKPKLTRLFFFILFIWACSTNYATAHNTPDVYLEYASFTPFQCYSDFINNWFKSNIIPMVTLIAIGQGLIALGMILKGRVVRFACIGAILFFLAIAPLGIGSGFPATIITAVAAYFILKKDDLNYLWFFNTK